MVHLQRATAIVTSRAQAALLCSVAVVGRRLSRIEESNMVGQSRTVDRSKSTSDPSGHH